MNDIRMRAKFVTVHHASGVGVAERWRGQYYRDGKWLATYSGPGNVEYEKLLALGSNPDIAAVAEIIGNKGWSYITCDGCAENVEIAVAIGEYETKSYCRTCITEAAHVLCGEAGR